LNTKKARNVVEERPEELEENSQIVDIVDSDGEEPSKKQPPVKKLRATRSVSEPSISICADYVLKAMYSGFKTQSIGRQYQ